MSRSSFSLPPSPVFILFRFSYRLLFFFSCSFSGYISFVPLALFLSVHFATTHFIHISLLILVLSCFILFVCSFVHFWSLVSSTCIFIVCIFLCSFCSYIPWCFGLSPRLFHWSYYLCSVLFSCVLLFLATPFGPSRLGRIFRLGAGNSNAKVNSEDTNPTLSWYNALARLIGKQSCKYGRYSRESRNS